MSLQKARLDITNIIHSLRQHEADLVTTYDVTPLDISVRSVIARAAKSTGVDPHVISAIAMACGIADSGSPIAPAAIITTVYAACHVNCDQLTAIGLEDLRLHLYGLDLDQGFSRALAGYVHGKLTEESYIELAKLSFMPGTTVSLIVNLRRDFISTVANLNHIYPTVGTKIKLDLIKSSNYLDKLMELEWIKFN